MKTMVSLLMSVMALFATADESVCHVFETNSTDTARRFHTFTAKTVKRLQLPKYVTSGLTHLYDAIHNVGRGIHQDGKIDYWKDIQGDKDLYITSTDNADFTENSLCFSYNSPVSPSYQYTERTSGICVNNQIPDSDIVTIEICAGSQTQVPTINRYTFPATTDMDMLVAQGSSSSSSMNYSCPFWIGFGNGSKSHNGNPYWLVMSRGSDLGWRGWNWKNDTLPFPANKHPQQFTISVSCTDRSQTTAEDPYCQPYYTASSGIFYDFGNYAYNRIVAQTNVSAKAYDTSGQNSSSVADVNRLRTQEHELQIGGLRYGTVFSGGVVSYTEKSFWTGHIYCVRIYNRKLTDYEKMMNALEDYRRFYRRDY